MSEVASEASPKIIFTNANFELSPQTFKSTAWLGEFAREAGFDGVEVHPIYHRAREVGRAAVEGDIDINSLHQSFRTTGPERNTNQFAWNRVNIREMILSSPAGRLLLPNMRGSAGYMRTVQAMIGHQLPGIFYPQQDAERDGTILEKAGTASRLFQPTDHVAALIDALSPEIMYEKTWLRGYDGFCLDTFHMRRRYGWHTGGVISDIATSLPVIAPRTKALHVSLNRADFADAEPHIPTRDELDMALTGNFTGELGEIMATIKKEKVGFVVVELGASALKEVTSHKSLDDVQKDYQLIGDSLRSFFA